MKYYSIHFNRPDFVEIQYKLSKIYNYDLVIINNGCNKLIKEISNDLKIEYYEFENIGSGSVSHGNCINQTLKLINTENDWGIIDHDMFITSELKMEDCEIISWKQENVKDNPYLWPGLIICRGGIDLSEINFLPGVGVRGDTGSDTYRILDKYKIKWVDSDPTWYEISKNERKNEICKFKINNQIIGYHYINGSNWSKSNDMVSKNEILLKLINKNIKPKI